MSTSKVTTQRQSPSPSKSLPVLSRWLLQTVGSFQWVSLHIADNKNKHDLGYLLDGREH